MDESGKSSQGNEILTPTLAASQVQYIQRLLFIRTRNYQDQQLIDPPHSLQIQLSSTNQQ